MLLRLQSSCIFVRVAESGNCSDLELPLVEYQFFHVSLCPLLRGFVKQGGGALAGMVVIGGPAAKERWCWSPSRARENFEGLMVKELISEVARLCRLCGRSEGEVVSHWHEILLRYCWRG